MAGLSNSVSDSGSAVGMAYQMVVRPQTGQRRFIYVSATCEVLNGITSEAAMADPALLYDLILPEYRERLAQAEVEAAEGMRPLAFEAPFRRPDGIVRWHRLTAAPRRLEDGSVLWDGFQVDVTDQRLAQRRLELAVNATNLGLWEYDVDSGDLYWSDRTRELFGLGQGDPVDYDIYQAGVHPEDREATTRAYRSLLGPEGGDYSLEHRTVAPDGTVRWILAHGRVVAEQGRPRLIVGTALDITQRKEAEEARALLLGELNHRVKNDFQIVSSLLQLQAQRARNPEVRRELEKALRRIEGVARAHQNIYADDGRAVVEMSDYLGAVCRHLSDGMFEGLAARLAWRVAPCTMPRERAVAIGLIVNELVTNAVKHAMAGARGGLVEVVFERDGEHLRLVVADDGPGLPTDYGRSKGIGCRLVQAFAKQAQGVLRIASAEGAGTRFILQMPA